MVEFRFVLWARNLATPKSNYGMRKDSYNGKVRSMWKNDDLWSQPQLFSACYQPDLSPEPPEGDRDGKWAAGSQNAVHELHPDTGKIGLVYRFLKNRGAQP